MLRMLSHLPLTRIDALELFPWNVPNVRHFAGMFLVGKPIDFLAAVPDKEFRSGGGHETAPMFLETPRVLPRVH